MGGKKGTSGRNGIILLQGCVRLRGWGIRQGPPTPSRHSQQPVLEVPYSTTTCCVALLSSTKPYQPPPPPSLVPCPLSGCKVGSRQKFTRLYSWCGGGRKRTHARTQGQAVQPVELNERRWGWGVGGGGHEVKAVMKAIMQPCTTQGKYCVRGSRFWGFLFEQGIKL